MCCWRAQRVHGNADNMDMGCVNRQLQHFSSLCMDCSCKRSAIPATITTAITAAALAAAPAAALAAALAAAAAAALAATATVDTNNATIHHPSEHNHWLGRKIVRHKVLLKS